MKDLKFKIGPLQFKVQNLVCSAKGEEEVSELLNYIKSSDPTHKVYEPIYDDIINENDNWEVYMAFNDSLIFEFLKDKLIYIAFDLRFLDKKVISLPPFVNDINSIDDLDIEVEFNHDKGCFQTLIDSDIVLAIILDEQLKKKVNVVAFGDFSVFSNEKNMPNRYSEILGGLAWI